MKAIFSFIVLIAMLSILMLFSGCSSIPTEDKAVVLDGVSVINIFDTGYNPLTKTFTPKGTSIVSDGTYCGIPSGDGYKDFTLFSIKESSSIWNAEARTSHLMLIVCTSSKEQMQKYLEIIAEKIKSDKTDKEQGAVSDGESANVVPSEPG